MARASLSFISFLRQNPRALQNPNIRNLTTRGGEGDDQQHFADIAKEVCKITRTRPRWEQTLISHFPTFNFSDPDFFRELLKHQNNAFLSLRFFHWLNSHHGFSPDPSSCNALFGALVEAKASNAAKSLLLSTNFTPDPPSLESFIQCLCENGSVQDALDVFSQLKGVGFCASLVTWNSALLGSLRAGRTDLVWKLYGEMMEFGVVADVDTVGYLIQALCFDNKVSNGYQLLRQVLEDGFTPSNAAFNKLISGFCKERDYAGVSGIIHTMIAKNCAPDIFTYQEIICGLCDWKSRKWVEAFRIFNDLKDRGYAPDRIMYTTMIHGLCRLKWIGQARKMWFEMIQKGYLPNEYTYNILILGFCSIGNVEEAWKLYREMRDRGYKETTLSYNTMIRGLCLNRRTEEAHDLFEEMPQKGVVRDLITYNTLIQGFCKRWKVSKSTNLLKELLAQGLQPSTSSYTPLIKQRCKAGHVKKAKRLWNDMQRRGVEPVVCTRDHIINGLCQQGYAAEGMEWLVAMLRSKLRPQKKTFERLIQCLSQRDRLDDALIVLDSMFKIGYPLGTGVCHSLVKNLCKNNSQFVEACLGEILDRN